MEYLKALSAQRIVNIEASSRAILDQVIAAISDRPDDVQSSTRSAPVAASDWIHRQAFAGGFDAVAS